MPIFAAKIFDDLFLFFLVIDQVFLIFSLFSLIFRIFILLDIVHSPFLTRKTPFSPFWRRKFFLVIRQHYISKYWGDECMGRPHLKLWGGRPPVPPRFPPLYIYI